MPQTSAPPAAQRIAFVDYARVLACFLVMLVHASEQFYAADASGLAGNVSLVANESNRFWVAFYDGTLGRISVPLFMMLSAFLLVPLRPGLSMQQFYRRRFVRIVPPLLVFMLLYVFLPPLMGQTTWAQAWHDLLLLPFTFPSMAGHLWFMYPLISLYLIIPVISPWLATASARDERTFLLFFVLSTTAPWLVRFVSADLWGWCFWNPYFGLFYYCSGYLGYLVLAHYVRTHLRSTLKRRLLVGTLCLVSGAVFSGWSFWQAGMPGQLIETPMLEWSWEFCTPNVLLSTFGAFLLLTCLPQHKAPALITQAARVSFPMYLVHLLVLNYNAPHVLGSGGAASPVWPVWIAIPALALITWLYCFLLCALLAKLPGSAYWLGADKR